MTNVEPTTVMTMTLMKKMKRRYHHHHVEAVLRSRTTSNLTATCQIRRNTTLLFVVLFVVAAFDFFGSSFGGRGPTVSAFTTSSVTSFQRSVFVSQQQQVPPLQEEKTFSIQTIFQHNRQKASSCTLLFAVKRKNSNKKEPTTKTKKKKDDAEDKSKKSKKENDNKHDEESYVPLEYDTHAAEVFHLIDKDGNGRIDQDELQQVLKLLNIDATDSDISALFKHLDFDQNGEIEFDEFLTWYVDAASSAQQETNVVMEALLSRRTVNDFDPSSEVPDSVVRQAIEAAIHAPNHKMTEPWNFILLGPQTIEAIAKLNASSIKDPSKAKAKQERWQAIPGWCVVTCTRQQGSDKDEKLQLLEQEDYAATCCAIQNFCLAMWAEGVGTKWTTGPVTRTDEFATLCNIDTTKQQVVGCVWFGYAKGGLASVAKPKRKRSIDDVLSTRP